MSEKDSKVADATQCQTLKINEKPRRRRVAFQWRVPEFLVVTEKKREAHAPHSFRSPLILFLESQNARQAQKTSSRRGLYLALIKNEVMGRRGRCAFFFNCDMKLHKENATVAFFPVFFLPKLLTRNNDDDEKLEQEQPTAAAAASAAADPRSSARPSSRRSR